MSAEKSAPPIAALGRGSFLTLFAALGIPTFEAKNPADEKTLAGTLENSAFKIVFVLEEIAARLPARRRATFPLFVPLGGDGASEAEIERLAAQALGQKI